LIEHFKAIFFTAAEPLSFIDPDWNFDFGDQVDGSFTDAELVTALTTLNGKAAVGPELVPSSVLKDVFSTPGARSPLLALMNLCFVSGNIPSDWGESEIFVLYKMKGARSDPNNYRGINLINDFCRIYERLLEGRLSTWMSSSCPQGRMQFGFRRHVSTADAFFLLTTAARYFTRVHEKICYACYVDLQKAFPSVLRSKVLESLAMAGAPRNTIRALASSFSHNSCRLGVNDFLSRPFPINRGVKEGGINSPSIFVIVYARVLRQLDVHEAPLRMNEWDPEKVYFFAFADDLALLSCNLSRVEAVLEALDKKLPAFGMQLNPKKTCWMPFLPIGTRYQVAMPKKLRMRLGGVKLECVDEFSYLGYFLNSFLSPTVHLKKKRLLLFSAAKAMGRLLRTLEITNLKSLRTYFITLVYSQQYGLELFSFNGDDYNRAAKVFLQTVFCLPDSFPLNVARNLLNLQHFELVAFDSRRRFIERIFSFGPDSMMAKALRFDQDLRLSMRSGFSHDLIAFLSQFFDVSDLDSLSLDDFSYLQDLRDQLSIQCDDGFRASFRRSSGLNFYADLTANVRIPPEFGEYLGELDFEVARIMVLFMGDVFRYSLAAGGSSCPFCPVQLHAQHVFLCPNCPFRSELSSWANVLEAFRVCDWALFVKLVLSGLYVWAIRTNFFRPVCASRIGSFLGRDLGQG
jgi:hypothetical protein